MPYVEGSVLVNGSFSRIARPITPPGEAFIISRLLGAQLQCVHVHKTRSGVTIRVEGAIMTVVRRQNHLSERTLFLEGNALYRLRQGQKIGIFPPEEGGSGYLSISIRKPLVSHTMSVVR